MHERSNPNRRTGSGSHPLGSLTEQEDGAAGRATSRPCRPTSTADSARGGWSMTGDRLRRRDHCNAAIAWTDTWCLVKSRCLGHPRHPGVLRFAATGYPAHQRLVAAVVKRRLRSRWPIFRDTLAWPRWSAGATRGPAKRQSRSRAGSSPSAARRP